MNFKIFLLAPALLLMSNCKTQTSQAETSVASANTIRINLEKQAKIPNSQVNLKFRDITEDSRCPVDVTCVWEGIAIVNIEATSGSQTNSFQVGTRDFSAKNVSKSFSFSGYKFTLVELKPQPGGKAEAASLTLKYEKE